MLDTHTVASDSVEVGVLPASFAGLVQITAFNSAGNDTIIMAAPAAQPPSIAAVENAASYQARRVTGGIGDSE